MTLTLRERFTADLKSAMHAKDDTSVAALRLILAALKDKDIAARTADSREGIAEDQILSLLQAMIKQRQESIAMYTQGARPELAAREQGEIDVIARYLPRQMSDDEVQRAIDAAVQASAAASVKDMGKVMAALKAKYAGQMDFSKAGPLVKARLGG